MGDIKVENADPTSSHPLVLDVMTEGQTEPTATHVLTFGDFIIVGALDNLVIVSFEDWTKRQQEAAAKAEAEAKAAHAPAAAAAPHAAASSTSATSGKMKRAELEAMTKDELVEYADDEDIEVSHSWSKADIVDAILKGQ